MANLYLFDIDGTLVDLTESHLKAYKDTFKQIAGRVPLDEIIKGTWGMTEIDCHKIILQSIGADISLLEKTLAEFQKRDKQEIASGNIRTLPGVREFLNYLVSTNQFRGIITGNTKITGEQILQRTNLIQYFQVFSYGDNEFSRANIIRSAIASAKRKGLIFNKSIIIGDTPADVESAKEVGTLSVAVATGHKSINLLRNIGADLVLNDLTEFRKIYALTK